MRIGPRLVGLSLAVTAVVSCLWAPAASQASTSVTADVTSNTTWNAAGSPYTIDSPVSVASAVTLTVQAGTVVKLASGASFSVAGTLNATGTAESRVRFTAQDLHASPAWGQFRVLSGGSATLAY